jgi:tetratricopeptide (TPR) repeat protein/TolB-like protein
LLTFDRDLAIFAGDMGSGDQSSLSDAERKNLLDEIRRRAEQAETERLDQDEQLAAEGGPPSPGAVPAEPTPPESGISTPDASASLPSDVVPVEPVAPPSEHVAPSAPTPFPMPVPGMPDRPARESESAPASEVSEERIAILKERLTIAIDRGKVDRASSILSELRHLVPDDATLADFELRLKALTVSNAPPEPPPPPPVTEAPPAPPVQPKEAGSRRARGPSRKSPSEMLEEAYSLYQQEKYDRALTQVAEVLALEPENEEALGLQEQIEKAKQISDLIRSEEQKRKAEEAAARPEPAPPPPVPAGGGDKDFWGAETRPGPSDGLDLQPEEKGPVGPPKPPVAQRLAERFSRVTIPWKPIAAVVLVALAGIIGYVVVDSVKNAVAPPAASLVVLPPSVPGEEPGTRYIVDGFLEDLVSDLSLAGDLRVTGVPTALAYRGSTTNPRIVARTVGASHYMQWSMSRVGEKLLVQTSLHDTSETEAVWVNRTEATPRELAGVRLELARGILTALDMNVDAESEPLLRRVPTRNAAAYDSYLRGREMARRYGKDSLALAAAFLADAVAKDSGFADAHGALGWVTMLTYEASSEPLPQYLVQSLGSVQRALQLGLKNSDVFRAWSLIELYRGQYDKALERVEDAARVGASDAEAQRRMAVMLVAKRQYDRAVAAATRATAIDPGNEASYSVLGHVHQFLGQFVQTGEESRASLDAALAAYDRGLRLAADRSAYGAGVYSDLLVSIRRPERAEQLLLDRSARVANDYVEYYKLARVKQAAGRPKDAWTRDLLTAQSLLQTRLRQAPGDAVAHAYLALTHTRLGQFKEAAAANRQARELSPAGTEIQYLTARMFALQRDKAKALEALEKAVRARYSLPDLLDMDLYNLRSDEGLIPIITRP